VLAHKILFVAAFAHVDAAVISILPKASASTSAYQSASSRTAALRSAAIPRSGVTSSIAQLTSPEIYHSVPSEAGETVSISTTVLAGEGASGAQVKSPDPADPHPNTSPSISVTRSFTTSSRTSPTWTMTE
jgi:hypothetical protein